MTDLVILPTYNERTNIVNLIGEIFWLLPNVHILVVDDNSPDGTASVVKDLQPQFPRLKLHVRKEKEGLGKAYLDVFQLILGRDDLRNVIMMDADFSHAPAYLPIMLKEAETHDVVIGSRYISGGGSTGWERSRRMLSFFGNFYCRVITKAPIHDFTGGFNLIRLEILRKIPLLNMDSSGYAFMIELKYLLWRHGARVKEIPIIFKNRLQGESKMSSHIVREGILAPWKVAMRETAKK